MLLAAQAPAAAPAQRSSSNVERAALAAIAAAVETPQQAPIQPASYGDVTVRPIAQKPTLFPDHDEAARVEPEQPATPETFIPQAAERAPLRAPRMPKFEELPMPAQAEIRQARGDAEDEHPQKSKLSLLQRLANVGLGRRDEETEPPIAARASGPAMPRRCPSASRSAPSPSKWRIRIRYRSTQSVRRRRVWTSMAARHLLPRRHRATTILISRPSSDARPTEVLLQSS